MLRLGQRKGSGGAEAGGVVEQAGFLLIGAEPVQGFHEEVMVHQEERGNGRIHPGDFGNHQAREQVAVAALGGGAQLKGGQFRQDMGGEFGVVPPLRGERCDLGRQEFAQLLQLPPLPVAEQ
ncbi:hypothetical protein D9M72_460030 [compost metagenome]